jgi:TolB-like protein/predicted Ser/Thr protein kinase
MSAKITGNEPTVAVPTTGTGPEPTPAIGVSVPPPAGSSPAVSTPPPHHVFAGRYEVLALVGAGGMGTVYRARDRELDEIVALKLLQRDVVDQPGMLDRFRQEVKLARRVTHRNVARTYDIGEHEGEKFLTMEFVEGESLSAKIAREGSLGRHEGVAVVEGLCAGLSAAHAAGVVHRDLKPDNILIATDGRVVITDFGIARALSDGAAGLTVGLALGTPMYMAPEQVEGRRDLDARADIYALGAILYEIVTGEHPFQGESIWAIAAARLTQPPPDPRAKNPHLPARAAEIIQKCMARDRDDRYASVSDVLAGMSLLTMPAETRERASSPPPTPALEAAKPVAVLPFRNQGPPEDEYLAEALTDDLIDALSMTPGLRVLARSAVARHAGADKDTRELGRELRVQVVVEGSVRRAGGALRLSVRVVSVADGFQLWAKRFDRPESQALSVSDEAAGAIADALTVRRSGAARHSPSDPRAVDLYLRGRRAFCRGWRDDIAKAVGLFEEALSIAPDDPTILAGYARAQARRFSYDPDSIGAEDAERRTRASAERALAIAPNLGEARAALANLKWVLGDAAGCSRDLREALRIAPGSIDVNEQCGRMLVETGEPQKGMARLRAALALEPNLAIAAGEIIRASALMGDWAPFDAAVEVSPNSESEANSNMLLVMRLAVWKNDPLLAGVLRRKLEVDGYVVRPEPLALLQMIESRMLGPGLHAAVARWGNTTSRAQRRVAFFQQLKAEACAYVDDPEGALEGLDAADRAGLVDILWLDRCPVLKPLRDGAGFRAVRERVAARAKVALDVLEGRAP